MTNINVPRIKSDLERGGEKSRVVTAFLAALLAMALEQGGAQAANLRAPVPHHEQFSGNPQIIPVVGFSDNRGHEVAILPPVQPKPTPAAPSQAGVSTWKTPQGPQAGSEVASLPPNPAKPVTGLDAPKIGTVEDVGASYRIIARLVREKTPGDFLPILNDEERPVIQRAAAYIASRDFKLVQNEDDRKTMQLILRAAFEGDLILQPDYNKALEKVANLPTQAKLDAFLAKMDEAGAGLREEARRNREEIADLQANIDRNRLAITALDKIGPIVKEIVSLSSRKGERGFYIEGKNIPRIIELSSQYLKLFNDNPQNLYGVERSDLNSMLTLLGEVKRNKSRYILTQSQESEVNRLISGFNIYLSDPIVTASKE